MTPKSEYLIDLIFKKLKNYRSKEISLEKENLKTIPFGVDPYFDPNDIELINIGKYKIMDKNMQKSGKMGQWMMRCTSSVQVNLDASTEKNMEEMVFTLD